MKRTFTTALLAASVCLYVPASAQEAPELAQQDQVLKQMLGIVSHTAQTKTDADEDYLATPFRPSIIETTNEKEEPVWRYVDNYDETGTYRDQLDYGCVRVQQSWDAQAGQWANVMRLKAIYDENGDMVMTYTDRGVDDVWRNQYRIVMTYDNQHNMLTSSQGTWDGLEYEDNLRWTNTYDSEGRLIEQQYENYANNEWSKGSLVKWAYDEAGHEIYHEYIFASGQSSSRTDRTYDDDGNLLSETMQSHGVNSVRLTYTYDANGNCLSNTQENWDASKESWYAVVQILSEYDEDGQIAVETTYTPADSLPAAEAKWEFYQKKDYWHFSNEQSHGYQFILSVWDAEDETWVQRDRETRNFNDREQQTNWASDTLNVNNGMWDTTVRETQAYDANGNRTQYRLQERNPNGSTPEDFFTNLTAFDYTYDENNNCTSVTTLKKQAKDYITVYYNNMASSWGAAEYDSWNTSKIEYLDLNDYVMPESVSLGQEKVTIKRNETLALQANVLPENTTNKEVHWQSLNENVASVDVDGNVRGLRDGTATIQATTLVGLLTASIEVEVSNNTGIDQQQTECSVVAEDGTIRIAGDGISYVRIYSANGILTAEHGPVTGSCSISTAGWANGLYVAELLRDGKPETYKLLVR